MSKSKASDVWGPATADQRGEYFASAEGVRISRARAMGELRRHGITDWAGRADFLTELGDHETYLATDVLNWLGY